MNTLSLPYNGALINYVIPLGGRGPPKDYKIITKDQGGVYAPNQSTFVIYKDDTILLIIEPLVLESNIDTKKILILVLNNYFREFTTKYKIIGIFTQKIDLYILFFMNKIPTLTPPHFFSIFFSSIRNAYRI